MGRITISDNYLILCKKNSFRLRFNIDIEISQFILFVISYYFLLCNIFMYKYVVYILKFSYFKAVVL